MGYYTDVNRMFTFIGEPTLKDIFSDIENIITAVAVTPPAELDSRLKHPFLQTNVFSAGTGELNKLGGVLQSTLNMTGAYSLDESMSLLIVILSFVDTWDIYEPTEDYIKWDQKTLTPDGKHKPVTQLHCQSMLKDYDGSIRRTIENLMLLAPFSSYIVYILTNKDGNDPKVSTLSPDKVSIDYLLSHWEGLDIGEAIDDINRDIVSEYSAETILETEAGKQLLTKLFCNDVDYITAALRAIRVEGEGTMYPSVTAGLNIAPQQITPKQENEESVRIMDEVVSQLPFTEGRNTHNESFREFTNDRHGPTSHLNVRNKPSILDILAPGIQADLTLTPIDNKDVGESDSYRQSGYRAMITIKSGSVYYQKITVPYSINNVLALVNLSKNPTAKLVADLWLAAIEL